MKNKIKEFTNRLDEVFINKPSRILNIYVTAGYPNLESTSSLIHAIQNAGADIIEVGMPYSDPLADGPVIQQSNQKAIANGMNLPILLKQLSDMKESVSVPLILMGYLNPVLQYGFEKFCEDAHKSGVSGLIIPDMPAMEFKKKYRATLEKNKLHFIFLVTPETSDKRILEADKLSSGFIYAVSSSSITGTKNPVESKRSFFERISNIKLNNPVLIGFGISTKEDFETASQYANGAIIGSALIRWIENSPQPSLSASEFVSSILA